jgi:hypothetical protein
MCFHTTASERRRKLKRRQNPKRPLPLLFLPEWLQYFLKRSGGKNCFWERGARLLIQPQRVAHYEPDFHPPISQIEYDEENRKAGKKAAK